MRADPVGLYVHIPFCKSKCNYCDFCSYPEKSSEAVTRYVDALIREISSYRTEPKIRVDTVFFGGGTPSILDVSEFERIAESIRDTFDILQDAEFTVEVNPATLTEKKCNAYSRAGVNRISIGLQSIHDNEQKKLGRIHNYSDFLESIRLASKHFSNISADVMYGIPEQSTESFGATLRALVNLPVKHVSAYGLIIEEGTPFYENRDSLDIPDEDTECDMYFLAAKILSDSGFFHYEISNYAKPGYECRHNLKYWHNEEYIGVGVAAASYYGKKRFVNTASVREYSGLDFTNYIRKTEESSETYEYVMLALRLSAGFSLEDYRTRFGCDFRCGRESILSKFEAYGYLVTENDRIRLTEKGLYISNHILGELL